MQISWNWIFVKAFYVSCESCHAKLLLLFGSFWLCENLYYFRACLKKKSIKSCQLNLNHFSRRRYLDQLSRWNSRWNLTFQAVNRDFWLETKLTIRGKTWWKTRKTLENENKKLWQLTQRAQNEATLWEQIQKFVKWKILSIKAQRSPYSAAFSCEPGWTDEGKRESRAEIFIILFQPTASNTFFSTVQKFHSL